MDLYFSNFSGAALKHEKLEAVVLVPVLDPEINSKILYADKGQ